MQIHIIWVVLAFLAGLGIGASIVAGMNLKTRAMINKHLKGQ